MCHWESLADGSFLYIHCYWLYECNVMLTGWRDSLTKPSTEECDSLAPIANRPINSVRYSRSTWSGWSESSLLTLCLTTVLSYQAVEFSRQILTLAFGGFCLCVFSVVPLSNFQSLHVNDKKTLSSTTQFFCLVLPIQILYIWWLIFELILHVQTSTTQLIWVLSVLFFLYYPPSPPPKKQQNMKHWTHLGMHVLNNVTKMYFGVVQIHVLKICLQMSLLLWWGGGVNG